MTMTTGVRCLTCLREGYHAGWCPDPGNTLMEVPQIHVEPRTQRRAAPGWAIACIVAGVLLMALVPFREIVALWVLMLLKS